LLKGTVNRKPEDASNKNGWKRGGKTSRSIQFFYALIFHSVLHSCGKVGLSFFCIRFGPARILGSKASKLKSGFSTTKQKKFFAIRPL